MTHPRHILYVTTGLQGGGAEIFRRDDRQSASFRAARGRMGRAAELRASHMLRIMSLLAGAAEMCE